MNHLYCVAETLLGIYALVGLAVFFRSLRWGFDIGSIIMAFLWPIGAVDMILDL